MNKSNLTCYYLHKTFTFEYYIQILSPQRWSGLHCKFCMC